MLLSFWKAKSSTSEGLRVMYRLSVVLRGLERLPPLGGRGRGDTGGSPQASAGAGMTGFGTRARGHHWFWDADSDTRRGYYFVGFVLMK